MKILIIIFTVMFSLYDIANATNSDGDQVLPDELLASKKKSTSLSDVIPPDGDGTVKRVDPSIRPEWNSFVNFLSKKGMRGNAALDDRDKGLGKQLLAEYKKSNPNSRLTYDMIPNIQQDLQEIRQQGLKDLRAGKIKVDGIKSEDEFMANLSPVDGWLGSKTSDHLYPTALLTNTTGDTKNFGTNTEAYTQAIQPYTKVIPKK